MGGRDEDREEELLGGEAQREEPEGGAWRGREGGTDRRGGTRMHMYLGRVREGKEEHLHEGRCQGTGEEAHQVAVAATTTLSLF